MDKVTTVNGHRIKVNGYSSNILHAKRNKRRDEAMARQDAHEKFTINQQIKKIKSRRGESKKELARINKKFGKL